MNLPGNNPRVLPDDHRPRQGTATTAGLNIRAESEHTTYRTGTKVRDTELVAAPVP
jgi:hypothetical protein